MRTDTRIQTDTLNDRLCIQSLHFRIRVQLVKVRDTQSQVGIRKQFHRFRFLQTHKQRIHILLDRSFLKQLGKFPGLLLQMFSGNGTDCLVLFVPTFNLFGITHDDPARIQVVIQCLAFPQELRREQQVELLSLQGRCVAEHLCILHIQTSAVTHRDGTLDHHHGIRIHLQHQIDHLFHVTCVEVILHRIIVGRCSDHHKIRILIGRRSVQCSLQVQILFSQVFFDVLVLNRTDAVIDFLYLFGDYVHSRHLVMLG